MDASASRQSSSRRSVPTFCHSPRAGGSGRHEGEGREVHRVRPDRRIDRRRPVLRLAVPDLLDGRRPQHPGDAVIGGLAVGRVAEHGLDRDQRIGPRVERIAYDNTGALVTDPGRIADSLGGRTYYMGRLELQFPTSAGLRSLGMRPSIYVDAGSLWNLTPPILTDVIAT